MIENARISNKGVDLVDPHSPCDIGEHRANVATESEAVQTYRSWAEARVRQLTRAMLDDPTIANDEFALRLHRLTYDDVMGLIRLQLAERDAQAETQAHLDE